mmetsp:Transcript_54670/g.173651  ORF Transcript_54670/g.173651 Transcript_54670/m.173651 type:complete len:219 (+) Transcript_54670:351-1007(+)
MWHGRHSRRQASQEQLLLEEAKHLHEVIEEELAVHVGTGVELLFQLDDMLHRRVQSRHHAEVVQLVGAHAAKERVTARQRDVGVLEPLELAVIEGPLQALRPGAGLSLGGPGPAHAHHLPIHDLVGLGELQAGQAALAVAVEELRDLLGCHGQHLPHHGGVLHPLGLCLVAVANAKEGAQALAPVVHPETLEHVPALVIVHAVPAPAPPHPLALVHIT